VQSKASHVVISRNNVSSMGEQKAYMGDTADMLLHHLTTAQNFAFAQKDERSGGKDVA